MKFNLRRAVNNLAKKDLNFLQPLYEAITNSLEANAHEIIVNIISDQVVSKDIIPKISGLSVEDDGDGFTDSNVESFLELWSDKKIKFGCKGSGRFTWLSVFNNVTIKSEVSQDNKLVEIPFSVDFEDSNIKTIKNYFKKSRTTVTFENITDRYYNVLMKIDNRPLADINKITESIEKNLLIRLFLLKNSGRSFTIKLNCNSQERIINNYTIPDLDDVSFFIHSDITKENYEFSLYYHFIEDGRNSKKMYYCANYRTVKEEDDDSLNFSCALPNKMSFNMLLCSKYLDEMVSDSRDDFPGMSNKRQANIACPLLFKDIKQELLKQMHIILMNKFPELEELNKEEERKAIETFPYLAKYIKENTDMIKTEKSLTVKALDEFNRQKIIIKDKFEKLLNDRSIESAEFSNAVAELSEVAIAELGEYVLYRNSIIKALQDSINNTKYKEEFIHNIFIPKGKIVSDKNGHDFTMTNMWLIDDKFMSFSNAFSDVSIRKVLLELFENNCIYSDKVKMDKKKPDIAIFYNKALSRDALVVEFKGLNATLGEKEKSIPEISRNCYLLKKKIKEIDTIWAYIITTIDDEFEVSLKAMGYKKRFSSDKNGKIMYFYNDGIAHIYALDIRAIVADADARNRTFLDILKGNNH